MRRSTRLQPRAIAISAFAGLAFLTHAMFDDVNAWPLVWPVFAGVALAIDAARRRNLDPRGAGAFAAKAAGVLALVVAAVGIPAAWLRVRPAIAETVGISGNTFGALAFTLLALAVLCAAVELGAAMLAYPLARRPYAQ